jgi:hypothetical protein
MKRFYFTLPIIISALTLISPVQAVGRPKVENSLLVSTDWLAKHLNDDSLVLLQVGEKDE